MLRREQKQSADTRTDMNGEFVVATEKGDKDLALLLRTALRRFGKYLALAGLAAALVATAHHPGSGDDGGGSDDGPVLRSVRAPIARAPLDDQRTNVALRPPADRADRAEWRVLTRGEIAQRLECDYGRERPVHSAAAWIGMREAYVAVVGPDAATLDLAPDVSDERGGLDGLATAFRFPVEVRQSPGKGRGIFALKAMKRGEVLYDFSQSAQFQRPEEYAEFLRILRPDLACDVLMWSYVQDFGAGDGPGALRSSLKDKIALRMVTDLDPGSFCNDGHRGNGNMAWLDAKGRIAEGHDHLPHPDLLRKDGTVREDAVRGAPLVAVRDVPEGGELYCIYGQFSEGTSRFMK